MFDNNAEKLIHWFENLEEKCQKLIFEKRDTWFQNNLEECDIESAFNSTIRVYKSGKYYLVRTNIKNNHNNLPAIKIYNEHEIPLSIDDINSETNIISILEIQGIKFTSRNFQIEIEMKQVMVLDNEPIFESCLIKPNKPRQPVMEFLKEDIKPLEKIKSDEIPDENNSNIITNQDENKVLANLDEIEEIDQMGDKLEKIDTEDSINQTEENLEDKSNEESDNLEELEPVGFEHLQSEDNISLEIEDLNLDTNIDENNNNLEELDNLDLALENNIETMQLKKPNQIYFELYKEARNKAKAAKKSALLAYLEAKNIKKTYMLENLYDSDSDIDAEIDEVSESELEGL
jgi:hypothetical protein